MLVRFTPNNGSHRLNVRSWDISERASDAAELLKLARRRQNNGDKFTPFPQCPKESGTVDKFFRKVSHEKDIVQEALSGSLKKTEN